MPFSTIKRTFPPSADRTGRRILYTYLEPDKSFLELREMVNSGSKAPTARAPMSELGQRRRAQHVRNETAFPPIPVESRTRLPPRHQERCFTPPRHQPGPLLAGT